LRDIVNKKKERGQSHIRVKTRLPEGHTLAAKDSWLNAIPSRASKFCHYSSNKKGITGRGGHNAIQKLLHRRAMIALRLCSNASLIRRRCALCSACSGSCPGRYGILTKILVPPAPQAVLPKPHHVGFPNTQLYAVINKTRGGRSVVKCTRHACCISRAFSRSTIITLFRNAGRGNTGAQTI